VAPDTGVNYVNSIIPLNTIITKFFKSKIKIYYDVDIISSTEMAPKFILII